MARKTKTLVIDSGRDKGKSFLITEMPVTRADKWANKALCNLLKAGIDPKAVNVNLLINTIDPNQEVKIDRMGGMLELATLLGRAVGGIPYEILQDLKDELIDECVQIIPSGGSPRQFLSIDDELESLLTLESLRKEALLIHIDFLADGSSQTQGNEKGCH